MLNLNKRTKIKPKPKPTLIFTNCSHMCTSVLRYRAGNCFDNCHLITDNHHSSDHTQMMSTGGRGNAFSPLRTSVV